MLYVYLGAAIFYLVSILATGWVGYDTGKDISDAHWQKEVIAQKEQFESELTAAMKRVEQQNANHNIKLVEAINAAEERNSQLESDIAELSDIDKRLYISTPKASCDRSEARADKDTSKHAGGTDRVELPAAVTDDLWGLAFDAQRVVGQYLAARELILSRQDCFELVE